MALTQGLFGRVEEGHYYFNYPKNGQLLQYSTLQKYVNLFPKVRWVGNAVHKRKLRIDEAENELWETFQPCGSLLQHVAKLRARANEKESEEQRRAENEKMSATLRPFVEAPDHIRERIELWRKVFRGGMSSAVPVQAHRTRRPIADREVPVGRPMVRRR